MRRRPRAGAPTAARVVVVVALAALAIGAGAGVSGNRSRFRGAPLEAPGANLSDARKSARAFGGSGGYQFGASHRFGRPTMEAPDPDAPRLPTEIWKAAMREGRSGVTSVDSASLAVARRWRAAATRAIAGAPPPGGYSDSQLRLALSDRFKLLTSLPWEESRRLAALSDRALYFWMRLGMNWEAHALSTASIAADAAVELRGDGFLLLLARSATGGTSAAISFESREGFRVRGLGDALATIALLIRYDSLYPDPLFPHEMLALERAEIAIRSATRAFREDPSEPMGYYTRIPLAGVSVLPFAKRRFAGAGAVTARYSWHSPSYPTEGVEIEVDALGFRHVGEVVETALRAVYEKEKDNADQWERSQFEERVTYWDSSVTCVCLYSGGAYRVSPATPLRDISGNASLERFRASISFLLPREIWGYSFGGADPRARPGMSSDRPYGSWIHGMLALPLAWVAVAPRLDAHQSTRTVRIGDAVYEFRIRTTKSEETPGRGGVFPLQSWGRFGPVASRDIETHQFAPLLFLPHDASESDVEYYSLLSRPPEGGEGGARVTEI
jgi:hypothetical protein